MIQGVVRETAVLSAIAMDDEAQGCDHLQQVRFPDTVASSIREETGSLLENRFQDFPLAGVVRISPRHRRRRSAYLLWHG